MIQEFLSHSSYWGVLLSIAVFLFGRFLNKKTKQALCNPMLISVLLATVILKTCGIPYIDYSESTKPLTWLLTPATICLAVPLYEQYEILKNNAAAILLGIGAGVLTAMCSIFALSKLMNLDHALYATLLPKSITTAIGISISEELGGYVSLTAAVIAITGICGNTFAETACKLFRITHPVAKGLAIGTASHAVGTSKALEIGQIEGAMSSLSIVIAGLLTVLFAPFFGTLI